MQRERTLRWLQSSIIHSDGNEICTARRESVRCCMHSSGVVPCNTFLLHVSCTTNGTRRQQTTFTTQVTAEIEGVKKALKIRADNLAILVSSKYGNIAATICAVVFCCMPARACRMRVFATSHFARHSCITYDTRDTTLVGDACRRCSCFACYTSDHAPSLHWVSWHPYSI